VKVEKEVSTAPWVLAVKTTPKALLNRGRSGGKVSRGKRRNCRSSLQLAKISTWGIHKRGSVSWGEGIGSKRGDWGRMGGEKEEAHRA